MKPVFRLRNPKNRSAYTTVEGAFGNDPNLDFQLYDRKGWHIGSATTEQIRQAAEASARGDVKEILLLGTPIGEVAKIRIDGTEYLVG